MAAMDNPPLEILAREPEGFSVWSGPPFSNGQPQVKLERVACSMAKFCENGSKLLVMKNNSTISVYEARSLVEIKSFEVPSVQAAILSPCGTYMQTFQKCSTPQDKNLILWNAELGIPVYQQHQKNMTKSTWPSIQFSSDEAVACRLAKNEIQFFDAGDFSKGVIYKLRLPGITAMEISKTPGSHVAAFVAESKGIPASVQIFASDKESQSHPVARRSFFRCSTVQLHWNTGATGLLIVAQADVDKSNQSYYGESKLNYLTTDGTHEGLVPLRKEGPIHDVQWSSTGTEFAVVYGFMPAKATIFDKKCNPLFELGNGPYNTIRWNPKGRFLCLAGFGNLPGDMAFWDFNEKKLLGTTKAEWSVSSEWSPNGLYFMTATTAPRLQVDNGIKVFLHNGALHYKRMFDKLYQADWRPENPGKFSSIDELIKSIGMLKVEETKPEQNSNHAVASTKVTTMPAQKHAVASTKVTTMPAQKPAAYRPPHAKQAAAAQAELFGGGPSEEMNKNALKNKKRREKQKEKKAAEAASAANGI